MKIKGFFLLFFLIFSSFAFGYINIYPLSFDKRIDGLGGIKDFILTNTTNQKVRYQINIDPSLNMSSWTEIYPRVITLAPGEKGEIKMYSRAPKETPIGEYSTILNIKELEVPTKNREKRQGVKVFTNLNIKLYGYVGKLDSSISLDKFNITKGKNINNLKIKGKIKNNSLRRIRLDFVLINSKNEILISEVKLKNNEVMDLSNLKLLTHNINNKEYKSFNSFKIYEKETGKILMEGDI